MASKSFAFAFAGAMIVALALAVWFGTADRKDNGAPAENGASATLARVDSQNGVTVEATPIIDGRHPADRITFRLTFTTHSGDLTALPIGELAGVSLDREVLRARFRWVVDKPDPHHMVGRLELRMDEGEPAIPGQAPIPLYLGPV